MGTSSSYAGPSGKNPLLPPWANDDFSADGEPQTTELPLPNLGWRGPKTIMGRLARGTGGGASAHSLRSLGRSYVGASGGSRTAARAAQTGRKMTARLGAFLSAGLRDGFADALDRLGLRWLVGQDAETALAAFVELLAPDGALRDEAVARTAIIATLSDLFTAYDLAGEGIEALDRMDADGLGQVVELSVVNYVSASMQQVLANRIELGTLPEPEANRLMDEVRDFIGEIVKLDFVGVDLIQVDWEGPEGRQLVRGIYEEAYRLVGGDHD